MNGFSELPKNTHNGASDDTSFPPVIHRVVADLCARCNASDKRVSFFYGSSKKLCSKCKEIYEIHLSWMNTNSPVYSCGAGSYELCHKHVIDYYEIYIGVNREFHPSWSRTVNEVHYKDVKPGSVLLFTNKDVKIRGITRVLVTKKLGDCRIGNIFAAEDSTRTKFGLKLYRNIDEYMGELNLLSALESEFKKETGQLISYHEYLLPTTGNYSGILFNLIDEQLPVRIRSMGRINHQYKPITGSTEEQTMLAPFTFKYLGADVTYKRVKSGTPSALVDVKERFKRSWETLANNAFPGIHFSDEKNVNILQYNVREPEGLDPGAGHAVMIFRTEDDAPAKARLCDSGGFVQKDTDKLHPTLKNKITDLYGSKLNTVLVEPVPMQLNPTSCFRHSFGNAIMVCAGLDPKGYQLDEMAIFGLIKDFMRGAHNNTKWLNLAEMIILHPVVKKTGFKIHLIKTDDS